VNDQGQADDILQDVFMRVHRQLDTVADPRRVVSWVYQITWHAIIDYYRKPGRQREVPAGLCIDIERTSQDPSVFDIAFHGDADDLRAELGGCLRPMIERLSTDYREAITLVELEGLTQQKAAKQMGLSWSGMKSRVQRGRKQLKQMLDDCCAIELDRRGGVMEYAVRKQRCNTCTSDESKACP
jgi:RNA polymerase sigma-70 factor (ECF subfamily)